MPFMSWLFGVLLNRARIVTCLAAVAALGVGTSCNDVARSSSSVVERNDALRRSPPAAEDSPKKATTQAVTPSADSGWPAETLVATNSIEFRDRARVVGGVAVTRASPGPVLASNAELSMGAESRVEGSVRVDTLFMRERSRITGNATFNQRSGSGTVDGVATSPLPLPLTLPLPTFPTISPGSQALTLQHSQTWTLAAGAKGTVTLQSGNGGVATRLLLSGGLYQWASLAVENDARIECLAACEVRVSGRSALGHRSFIGPSANSGLTPGQVRVFFRGTNGGSLPGSTPSASLVDHDSTLKGFLYVPNGTARFGDRVSILGKVIARDISLGESAADGSVCAVTDTTCNGIDDDCDGVRDDEFQPLCEGSAVVTCVNGRPAPSDCNDRNACNGTETCAAAQCVAGTPPVVDDGNVCTSDSCNPAEGVVNQPLPLGTACPDANVCNGGEACDGQGHCASGTPLDCDDDNVCTGSEACDSTNGCTPGIPLDCDDDNACNGQEICDPTLGCRASPPLDCDDDDACNGQETCDATLGCRAGSPLDCGDDDACNGVETCQPSTGCEPGVPPIVDDGNVCTEDNCDPDEGVTHAPVADGSVCASGNICEGIPPNTCRNGQCAPFDGTFIPNNADGYLYKVYAYGSVPPNYGSFAFDDGDFQTGGAPFASGGGCPIQARRKTTWPLGTEIVVRRQLDLPRGARNLRVRVAIDNDIEILFNETNVTGGIQTHEGCADSNQFEFSIPDSLIVEGENLIVLRGRDRGAEAALDILLRGEVPGDNGQPPLVDDGNPCTADSCDPVLGVVHTPMPSGDEAVLYVATNQGEVSTNEVHRYRQDAQGWALDAVLNEESLGIQTMDVPSALLPLGNGDLLVLSGGADASAEGNGLLAKLSYAAGTPFVSELVRSSSFNRPQGFGILSDSIYIAQKYGQNLLRVPTADIAQSPEAATSFPTAHSRRVTATPWGEMLVSKCCSDNRIDRFLVEADGSLLPNGTISGNGISNPHDLEFSPWGELFVVSANNGVVSRFTFNDDREAIPSGVLSSDIATPLGLAFTPTGELFVSSNGRPEIHHWTFDAAQVGTQKGTLPAVTTLSDIAFECTGGGPNEPPMVDAGVDTTVPASVSSVALAGRIGDDGKPTPGVLVATWSQVSGPGVVTFDDATDPATSAAFSAPGTYVLRLEATDGELVSGDTVSVSVNEAVAMLMVVSNQGGESTNEVFQYAITEAGGETLVQTLSNTLLGDGVLDRPVAVETLVGGDLLIVNRGAPSGGSGTGGLVRVAAPTTSPVLVDVVTSPFFNVPHFSSSLGGETYVAQRWGSDVLHIRQASDASFAVVDRLAAGFGGTTPRGALQTSRGELLISECCGVDRVDVFELDVTRPPELVYQLNGNGLSNPHDLVLAPWGELFVANADGASVSRFTRDATGRFVAAGSFSDPSLRTPVGLAWSPWGELFIGLEASASVARWTVTEDGGAAFREAFAIPQSAGDVAFYDVPSSTNAPPSVDGGDDLTLAGSVLALKGRVWDDGLPLGAIVNVDWQVASGPAPVAFADASKSATEVQFATPGTYVLRLEATDGELNAADEVVVTVLGDPGVAVPDVVGQPLAAASGMIVQEGLQVGAVTSSVDGALAPLFDVLPSQRGWRYRAETRGGEQMLSEEAIFSVRDGVLHMDSMSAPMGGGCGNFYLRESDVRADTEWTVRMRGRILAEQRTRADNTYGLSFGAGSGGECSLGIGIGSIRDVAGREVSTTIDTTVFHDYELTCDPLTNQYRLFIDDVMVAQNPMRDIGLNRVFFGDGTCGANAKAEIAALEFRQAVVSTQDPLAGALVAPGSNVDLDLQSGPATVFIPDLAELTEDQALETLDAAQLVVGRIRFQGSDDVPQGRVISQKPLPASKARPGEAVSLVVSQGPIDCVALPADARSLWRAEQTTLDELTGGVGQPFGGITYAPAVVASGWQFSSGYVEVPHSPAFEFTGGLTVEGWFRPNGWGGTMLFKGDGTQSIWALGFDGGTERATFVAYNSAGNGYSLVGTPARSVPLGEWTHIAATVDSTATRVFVDGSLVATTSGVFMGTNPGSFVIGANKRGAGRDGLFAGSMDEVTVYGRALSSAEIGAIYNANVAGKCPLEANQPPTVLAGSDQSVDFGEAALLLGEVTDDGLPASGTLTSTWSKIDGPGTVSFADAFEPTTSATFNASGTYVLRLEATDGELTSFDEVTIDVDGSNGCDLEALPPVDPVRVAVGPGSWTATPNMPSAHPQHATATALPNGQVLVAGGWSGSASTAAADLYSPGSGEWLAMPPMSGPRYLHSSTLLSDGRVFIAGGWGTATLGSTQVFDGTTRAWTTSAPMPIARASHIAALLSDGRVLVAGGTGVGGYLASSAIYDPVTDSWATTSSMSVARGDATAAVLPDGRVLVVGGRNAGVTHASAEVYDPATNSWSPAGTMTSARFFHASTLVDGKLLVAGGLFGTTEVATAELFDPATGSWSSAGRMSIARAEYTALTLLDGRAIVVGGGPGDSASRVAEVFDPTSNRWSPIAWPGTARRAQTAALLYNGDVLIAGGRNSGQAAEIYRAGVTGWLPVASMNVARHDFATVRLCDGRIFVAGGFEGPAGRVAPTAAAETYDASADRWTRVPDMSIPRSRVRASLLPDGRVLVSGGVAVWADPYTTLTSAEIFDPETNTWELAEPMSAPRYVQAMVPLFAGNSVLVTGGWNGSPFGTAGSESRPNAELFNATTNDWVAIPEMRTNRHHHTATVLDDGRVLVAAGTAGGTGLGETFDPVANTWTPTGPLGGSRFKHRAVRFPDGRVMVAGGFDVAGSRITRVEIFEPSSNAWATTVPLSRERVELVLELLDGSRVLAAGGWDTGSSEIYDIATGTWSSAPSMNLAHGEAGSARLPNGLILVAGGLDQAGYTQTATEIFQLAVESLRAPTARDDNFVVAGSSLTVAEPGVLSNDLDTDGQSLSVTLTRPPSLGSVALQPDGAFTYTRTPPFTGEDTFAYRVETGASLSNEAVVTLTPSTVNVAPIANAGPDQTVELGQFAALSGSVLDDGLPVGGTFTSTWSKIDGPGTVSFADASAVATTATFSAAGTYVLRLTATDGALSAFDEVSVVVEDSGPINLPPTVFAGADFTTQVNEVATLSGTVTDDGLPSGTLEVDWSLVSGPGGMSLQEPDSASTQVIFDAVGTYVLRLTANDGEFAAFDEMSVTVEPVGPPVNQPPVVNAGPDRTAFANEPIVLVGSYTDDGLPVGGPVTTRWYPYDGPDDPLAVDFGVLELDALFPTPGTYEMVLVVDDGEFESIDFVTIEVAPERNKAPVVNAGPDQGIRLPANTVTLSGSFTDDGLAPGGPVTTEWTQIAGPEPAQIASPLALSTVVAFSLAGTYEFELTADDGDLTGSDRVTIFVNPNPNRAPSVEILGANVADIAVGLSLGANVTDDQHPIGGQLTVAWEMASGPPGGIVTFASPNTLSTTVQFSVVGDYVLRLTADDSELQGVDTHTVTVTNVAAPTVALTSPTDGSSVTEPTDVVGSVTSTALANWVIEVRDVDDSAFRTMATGTNEVANDVIGVLDPTLLVNGQYELRLTATDTLGRSASASTVIVVEGNMKVGNFTVSFRDLSVPLAGIPIEIVRTYDSRDKAQHDFGTGWNLDIRTVRTQEGRPIATRWYTTVTPGPFGIVDTYCIYPEKPHLVTVTLSDGEVFKFEAGLALDCQDGAQILESDIVFTALPGTNAQLVAKGDTTVFLSGAWPGSVDLFDLDGGELFDTNKYELVLEDGRVLDLDQTAGLEGLRDLNGNELTITHDGIFHSSGESISFERDVEGRITTITDPMDQVLTYAYDAADDLISFTDRAGNETTFDYDTDHYLLSIFDPLGREPIRNEYDDGGRLLAHTDANGNRIEYTHNIEGREELVTDRLGNTTRHVYDDRGNVLLTTNPLGGNTSYTYDGNDNQLTECNHFDECSVYTYDGGDHRLTETDPLGNTTTFTYDTRGNVLTVEDALGRVTTNEYDGNGNLVRTEDAAGNETTYTYDARGLQTSTTDALGGVTTSDYDGNGNLVREVDAAGKVTEYTYDGNGNRLSQTTYRTTSTGLEALVTSFEYDAEGRLIETTHPDGSATATEYNELGQQVISIDQLERPTEQTYDDLGRVVNTLHADGTSESTTYDAEGRRLTSTDRAGRTTTFEYDAAGRLISTENPDGTSTSTEYDQAGRTVSTTDETGATTEFEYDAAGRRIRVTDPMGNVVNTAYDALGNQVATTDAGAHTTNFEYDLLNRQVRVVHPDASFDRTEYDALGRRTAKIDQAGLRTEYGYDAAGRLVSVTDAAGGFTAYAYDEQGNQLSQTDALGHATMFDYDAMGRRTRRTLPAVAPATAGALETMTYDAAGNLLTKTDFMGRTTSFAYDVNSRLLTKTFPDSTTHAFTYTVSGQRATATDARGTTSYAYDVRGRLTSLTYPGSELRQLTYGYDAAGRRTSMTVLVDGQTLTTQNTYDASGRLSSVIEPSGGVHDYAYDEDGLRTTLTQPNDTSTTYTYDLLHRLMGMATVHNPSTSTIQSYAYTLGATGIRTGIAEADGTVRSYGYDALYRLTSEAVTGSGSDYTKAFVYDAVGNRSSQTTTGFGAATVGYTYDERDRLMTENGVPYGWDENGNQLSNSDGATYAWDFDDRLVSVELADGTVVEHVYDVDGVRVQSTTTPPGGTAEVRNYLADTSGALSHVVALTNGAGDLQAYYVRGGDQLLAVIRGGVARYYHADGLGSVRALTDENGDVTDAYSYTAFGEDLDVTGSDVQPYRFAGEEREGGDDSYYLRARHMGPESATFFSVDRMGGSRSAPRTQHRYLYSGNDPVNLIDPSGNSFLSLAVATIATVAVTKVSLPFINIFRRKASNGVVKVYTWPFLGKGQQWGHASMSYEGRTATGANFSGYVSWWPGAGQSNLFSPDTIQTLADYHVGLAVGAQYVFEAPALQNRTFAQDQTAEQGSPTVTEIRCLDVEKLHQWWFRYQTFNKTWSTTGPNCSSTVAEGLVEAGALGFASLFWTPDSVESFARFNGARCK